MFLQNIHFLDPGQNLDLNLTLPPIAFTIASTIASTLTRSIASTTANIITSTIANNIIYINKSTMSAKISAKFIKSCRSFGWARKAPMIQPSARARKDPRSGLLF